MYLTCSHNHTLTHKHTHIHFYMHSYTLLSIIEEFTSINKKTR